MRLEAGEGLQMLAEIYGDPHRAWELISEEQRNQVVGTLLDQFIHKNMVGVEIRDDMRNALRVVIAMVIDDEITKTKSGQTS
jgi:hypothetical protein